MDISLVIDDAIVISESLEMSYPNFIAVETIAVSDHATFAEPIPPWENVYVTIGSSVDLTYLTSTLNITEDLVLGYDINYTWGKIVDHPPIRQKTVQIYCGTDLANGILIAADTGSVDNQDQTIYTARATDFVGTGTGTGTEFYRTLIRTPIIPGTVYVTAIIPQATQLEYGDDGFGNFSNMYFTGTINYVTGELYLSFIYPYFPVDLTQVQAKYTYTVNPFVVFDPIRFSNAFINYFTGYIGVDASPQSGETIWIQYKTDILLPNAIAIRSESPYILTISKYDVFIDAAKYVDLIRLVPENYRTLETLVDYLDSCGLYLGRWLTKIDDIKYLVDPYTVSDQFKESIPSTVPYATDEEYISHLSSLIGLTIRKSDTSTITDFRRQLLQAIDWYKLKGTYLGIKDSIYATNHAIQIKDMYTNDYASFTPVDWFVADYPGENPPGLDPSYYKSPHFGLNIELDTMKTLVGGYPYLWNVTLDGTGFDDIQGYVEQIRPANTVPHYIIHMVGTTHEDGVMDTITSSQVKTRRLYEPWTFSTKYFDNNNNPGQPLLNFNDGEFFDNTYTSFLMSINKWKLGTGNKLTPPDNSGWAMQNVVLSGTIPTPLIRSYLDRTEYEIVVPATTANTYGLSELGLYLTDDTTLVIGCTFPDVDKQYGMEFRILIILYKT